MSAAGAENKNSLSEHLKQLKEELHCPLCLDYFEDPVSLPCQHNLCRGCTPGLVRPSQRSRHAPDKRRVECPLCRQTAELNGTAEECVKNLPRNFHLAGIVEKFRAAEAEKKRTEEAEFQRQLDEQIERSRHDEEQRRQPAMGRQQSGDQCGSVSAVGLSLCKMCSSPGEIQCTRCNSHFCLDCQQIHSHEELGEQMGYQQTGDQCRSVSVVGLPQCKMCSSSGVIQCTRCNSHFCLECQQIHSHEELDEQNSYDREQQLDLQRLQEKQRLLELEREQVDALAAFQPTPQWHKRQTERWDELQRENQSVRRQASEQHPPPLQDKPQEPYSWPLGQQDGQVYQQQISFPGYSYQGEQQQQQFPLTYLGPYRQTFFPTSPTNQINCSHCKFPAVKTCQKCRSYFCWQCLGVLHDPSKEQYKDHNVGELAGTLSNILQLSPGNDSTSSTGPPETLPLVGPQNPQPVHIYPSAPSEKTVNYKLPFTCEIKDMGPGKHFVVNGKPFKQNLKRFHINLMCGKIVSSDLALHFNPRFVPSKIVVRNSRIGGKYGREERGASSFPFAAGRPFKIEINCHLDNYEVRVDDKPFITYAHRIKDLRSIKYFHIIGDVEVFCVEGCT